MDYQYSEGIIRDGGLSYFVESDEKFKDPSAKNGEAIARENELYVLREVRKNGTIREDELAILLGWSKQMVQRTVLRLVDLGKIVRIRAHGSFFVAIQKRKVARKSKSKGASPENTPSPPEQKLSAAATKKLKKAELTKKKLDAIAKIPPKWRHDALSIQVLGELRNRHPKSRIETEAEFHARIQNGKIPDGQILGTLAHIRIETEMSNKTSKPMAKQTHDSILLSKEGITTVFAYFYPPAPYYKFDWEHRLASSIRSELGHDNPNEHIKFLRCYVPKIIDFNHCRPTHFEMMDLPPKPDVSRIGQGKTTLGTEIIHGLHWKKINEYIEGGCLNEIHELQFDNHKRGTYKFIEAPEGLPHELLEQLSDGSWVRSPTFPALQAWDVFSEFLAAGKFLAEKIDLTQPNKFE